MLTYEQQQYNLFESIESKFSKGESPSQIVATTKDFKKDKRMFFSGVTYLPSYVRDAVINKIITPLRQADSRQYFYPPDGLHITIQNIRASNHPPCYTQDDIEKAQQVFHSVIRRHNIFSFRLQGLFELPTSLAVRAFSDESLKSLVLELRHELIKAGVPDDKHYASSSVFFGNATFCRYTHTPNSKFLKIVRDLKSIELERLTVETISLVTANAGANPESTTIIEEYKLQ